MKETIGIKDSKELRAAHDAEFRKIYTEGSPFEQLIASATIGCAAIVFIALTIILLVN